MSTLLIALAGLLLLNLAAGSLRALRGPTAPDRLLAANLATTSGAAVLLLLGDALALPAARDAALLLGLFAVLLALTFSRLPAPPGRDGESP